MKRSRMASATITSLAIALAVFGTPVIAAGPTTRYVDDDGTAGRSGCDGMRRVPRKIQRAIDASRPRDIVRVCPGTYTEQLTVGVDDLSLVAAQPEHPVIRPPRRPAASALADSRQEMSLIIVAADGVTIEGFTLRPHGGSGRCRSLVADDGGEVGLLEVGGNSSVTVRDTSFTAAGGSRTCSGYDHAVLASTDLSKVVIRLERVLIRDYGVDGVSITAYGHGEPNELVVDDSRFEVTRQPRGWYEEPALAVRFAGARAVVTDTVVEVGPGIVANGVAVYSDVYDFFDLVVEIGRNRMTGVTTGLVISGTGSGEVTGNVLAGSGAQGGGGIYVSGYPLTIVDNVVSGFGGPGLVVGGTYVEDEEPAPPHAIIGNDLRGNAGIDCVDGSAGPLEPEPSPSANAFYGVPARTPTPSSPSPAPLQGVWSDNRGEESMPEGLCTP